MSADRVIVTPYLDARICAPYELRVQADVCERAGAYGLFVFAQNDDLTVQESLYDTMQALFGAYPFPAGIAVRAKRFEDIKKAFYTGASYVLVAEAERTPEETLAEAVGRFGSDRLFLELPGDALSDPEVLAKLSRLDLPPVLLRNLPACPVSYDGKLILRTASGDLPAYPADQILLPASYYQEMTGKLAQAGIFAGAFYSSITFDELKTDANGLVPCIVQDAENGEVLMMAYMNRASFDLTVETGRMTYYSRSRKCLWVKGETSGHLQFVRSLSYDCDADTLLAKVLQRGAACHTGNRSCFYRDAFAEKAPVRRDLSVLEEVYETILDRKEHPKEGSYTNYLFDKGIDKILKKCGEESAEILIAAKNPGNDELKYEIADYLYHLMVLMAEKGISWEEIAGELSDRH